MYAGTNYDAGQTLDINGKSQGWDNEYLQGNSSTGGTITNTGSANYTAIRFIDAMTGHPNIRGTSDWGVDSGWMKAESGVYLRKFDSNLISWTNDNVINDGVVKVFDGTLEIGADTQTSTRANIKFKAT